MENSARISNLHVLTVFLPIQIDVHQYEVKDDQRF